MDKLMIFLLALLFIVIIAFIIALPVMLLWNWLMPLIFGLIKINFWQALGISLFSGLLLKSNISNSKD